MAEKLGGNDLDPLTHSAVGAVVAGIFAGNKEGSRAPLYGALAGALPDIDIIPTLFMDPLAKIEWHRGFTHSILFALLIALSIGYLIHITLKKKHVTDSFIVWFFVLLSAILAHILIDCLTTYGTRIFLPFSDYRVALGTIAVVDPLFTLPIILSALSFFAIKNNARLKRIMFMTGIFIGSAYLAATVVNKLYIDTVFTTSLKNQKVEFSRLMTSPMPFSNILWLGIAEGKDCYYTGYYSILDRDDAIIFSMDKKNHDYINGLTGYNSIKNLINFARDYYSVDVKQGELVFNDLRYGSFASGGAKKEYMFSYIIKNNDGRLKIVRKVHSRVTPDTLKILIKRISGEKEVL